MRVGIVSDTHDHMANVSRIVELFNEADVDHVVHTGDITQAKTLNVFAGLEAPLVGVWGNNDLEREGLEAACLEHGMQFREGPLHLEWAGRRLVVVHDPRELTPELLHGCHVALHGHDHRHTVEMRGQTLVINPGESAGHVKGSNAVGILDLVRLQTEIVNF